MRNSLVNNGKSVFHKDIPIMETNYKGVTEIIKRS